MAALDYSSLKSYVSSGAPRSVSSGTVLLDVQHSLIQQRFVEIPFDVHSSLDSVKDKIHSLCGTPPHYQQLYLNGPTGTLLSAAAAPNSSAALSSSSLSLSSFGVVGGGGGGSSQSQSGHYLYVVDTDPFALGRNGALHDVSQVKKYVMSDEEYKKRDNTYRAFKERQRQADPNWQSIFQQKAAAARQQHDSDNNSNDSAPAESLEEVRQRIAVGSRCVIQPADRRGTVKYVGSVVELSPAAGSYWIGVDLDEPVGKHAGTVLGKSYFTARGGKHGTFVKPANVVCGNYPEIDPFDEDEHEDKDEAGQSQQSEQQHSNVNSATQSHTQSSQAAQSDKSALYEEL